MNNRLTIWIDDREALPVRAIPYVAGWDWLYSPDVVAKSLARTIAAPFGKLLNLVAYHRTARKPLLVVEHEWATVVADINGFETELHERRPGVDASDDHVGYAMWRKGAALKLPAGVFVWLDEFMREREADRKRKQDDAPVTFSPMLDARTRGAVLEGFEDCARRGPDADQTMIGYADFAAICHVDDPKNFGGLHLKANGLFVGSPVDAETGLETCRAMDEWEWDSTNQYEKPALALPCQLKQLREFLQDKGIAGCIDEETVNALLGEQKQMQIEELPANAVDNTNQDGSHHATIDNSGREKQAELDGKDLPWWQKDYDIMVLASYAGDSLLRKKQRTSNRAIGNAIAHRIEAEERRGKNRKPPSGEHIKNTVLKGWKYRPDKVE